MQKAKKSWAAALGRELRLGYKLEFMALTIKFNFSPIKKDENLERAKHHG